MTATIHKDLHPSRWSREQESVLVEGQGVEWGVDSSQQIFSPILDKVEVVHLKEVVHRICPWGLDHLGTSCPTNPLEDMACSRSPRMRRDPLPHHRIDTSLPTLASCF